MIRKVIAGIIIVFSLCQSAFAGHYIADNRRTYIGETDRYYCYIYDSDVQFVIYFSTFRKSGSFSANIILEPKFEYDRNYFISILKDRINSGSLKTMLLPNRDNKFWAMATRLTYYKPENKILIQNDFWLNEYGEIIASTNTAAREYTQDKALGEWQIMDLMDAYIHAQYKEEVARNNSVVR